MKLPRFFVVVAVFAMGLACFANPTLPTLFTDHMVLQQGREIHVWGQADPGEKISVSLAGHEASIVGDATGRWSLHLPGLTAGGPFTLSVRGVTGVVVKDVMIGEVWIASGQSNMAFELASAEGAATEVPNADYPQIRFFTVPKKIALSPQTDVPQASWKVCDPDSAKSFSAVAYFFARELQKKLNVPIGIIHSSWPGTTVEEWIDPSTLSADPELKTLLDSPPNANAAEKNFAANGEAFSLQFDDFELIPADGNAKVVELANFDGGTIRTSYGGQFSYAWLSAPDTNFDLSSPGRNGSGFALRVAGQIDGSHSPTTTAHYKFDGSALDLTAYAGIRFWVRGNGGFRFHSLQPTVTDWDNYSEPVRKVSPEWQQVVIRFQDLHQDGWGVAMPFTQDSLSGFSIDVLPGIGDTAMPVTGLFQGMIAPVLPFPVRGALWYQGESNALKAHQYRKLLPALIQSWREGARNQEMEFLIVQLPNHGARPEQPEGSAWGELREAQLLTVQHVPHTGLAVTIDIGDAKDVHPHHKLEVGQRLALWALGTTFKQAISYSGPLYETMKVQDREVRIHFAHTGSGLEARGGEILKGFAIAGDDRKFHWADARIDGDTVVVSSSDVPKPVAVRYAWADDPRCNLISKDGLPASPFRTDDWPGITGGN